MDYKSALKLLAWDGPSAEFDSRRLSDMLLAFLEQRDIADYISFAPKYSTKRISGDLDRLYKMGFLNRKRVKRIIHPRSSKQIARGFTYVYTISKQGWQYLHYLSNQKAKERTFVDKNEWLLTKIADDAHRRVPEPIADIIEDGLFRKHHEDRGRYRRFPSQKYRTLTEALAKCQRKLARKEREVQRLEEKIRSRA